MRKMKNKYNKNNEEDEEEYLYGNFIVFFYNLN